MPVRRPLVSPVVVPRSSYYSTPTRHDYGIDDSIDRAEYFSNAVLDDTYDQARVSKNRDNALLRNTRAAIISTEQHVSPRAAAVSRRIRASTAPPVSRPTAAQPAAQPTSYTKVEEEQLQYRPSPAPRPFIVVVPSNPRASSPARVISKPVVFTRGGSVPPPSVAQRRSRAVSVPPRPISQSAVVDTSGLWAHRPYPLYKDVVRRARAASVGPAPVRASSVGPAPVRRASYYGGYPRTAAAADEAIKRAALPTSHLHAHHPRVLNKDLVRLARARAEDYPRRLARASSEPRDIGRASDYYYSLPAVRERALQRYLYAERARAGPTAKPKRVSLGDFPQVYVPWKGQGPSNRSKAAIIGSRMETDDAGAKKPPKRPRSAFAANKLREFKIQDIEEGIYYRQPIATGALHSSKPPLPKPTDRKAIRDVDGFTKPKNVMSWQYRVESRLSPDDIIYQPSSYIRLREQVRDAQEKMDRQRQLLDRYLDVDNFSVSSSRKDATSSS